VFGYTVVDTELAGGPFERDEMVIGGWSDEQAGDYHQFDMGTCLSQIEQADGTIVTTFIDEDEIETWEPNSEGGTGVVRSNSGDGHGIHFEALTIGWPEGGPFDVPSGFAVGNRPAFNWTQQPDGSWIREREVHEGNTRAYTNALGQLTELQMHNMLFRFDVTTGEIINDAGLPDRQNTQILADSGTNKIPLGQLLTDWVIDLRNDSGRYLYGDNVTGSVIDPQTGEADAVWKLHDEDLVPIDLDNNGTADVALQMNTGPDVRVVADPFHEGFARKGFVIDGDRIFLDGQAYEVDTGATIVVGANSGEDVTYGWFDVTESAEYDMATTCNDDDPWTYRFHVTTNKLIRVPSKILVAVAILMISAWELIMTGSWNGKK